MRVKLTDTAIRSYQPRATQYAKGDAACPGLCVRITPKGVKSFAFAYRNRTTRKVEWLTLGRYPDVPLTKAREIANDARKAVANGETPIAAKVRHVEAERAVMTYAKVVALYYDAHLSTLRTGRNIRTTLERIGRLYRWNERPVASISDDEAAIVLSDIAERRGKKRMANQAKHLLHGMFKWAKQPGRKFVTINPFSDLPAPGGPVVTRERFLSAEEIRQVWRALDDPKSLGIKPDAATALRLILTTAARPGMVRSMVGTELRDLRGPSEHGPHWSLPAKRMKGWSCVHNAALGLGAGAVAVASQNRCECAGF
jgi:Arm DNA-binding domain